MAVTDKLLAAARRPDCIMAVFPYQGGIWASPLGGASGVNPIPGSATTGSWAVRNGLLSYSNMEIKDGVFSNINPATLSWVDTKLDLRGKPMNYTFIIRAKFGENLGGDVARIPLITQGRAGGVAARSCFSAHLTPTSIRCYGYDTNGIGSHQYAHFDSALHHKFSTYAITLDFSNGVLDIKIFVDGELKSPQQRFTDSNGIFGYPTNLSNGGDRVRLDGVTNLPDYASHQYEYGMVFNRALTAEEIKALS